MPEIKWFDFSLWDSKLARDQNQGMAAKEWKSMSKKRIWNFQIEGHLGGGLGYLQYSSSLQTSGLGERKEREELHYNLYDR